MVQQTELKNLWKHDICLRVVDSAHKAVTDSWTALLVIHRGATSYRCTWRRRRWRRRRRPPCEDTHETLPSGRPVIILTEVKHSMGILSGVVRQLKRERERAQREVQRIDAALAALGGLSSNGPSSQHTMSAAGRKRISLAQKARWAKRKARPVRTISAAGRRRIAAAQRKRWAQVKGEA